MTSLWFRVYHALLYLYPADLRRRDGREMERLCSDLVDAERHARGSVAASRAAARMCGQVVLSALRAHWDARKHHLKSRRVRVEIERPASVHSWVDNVTLDLWFATRTFRRNPGFAAVTVLTLALGIGATTAMFSVVNGSMIRRPPFADPDRLVMVYLTRTTSGEPARRSRWSYPEFEMLRQSATVFEGLAAYNIPDFNLGGDVPEHIEGEVVSATYFDVLGLTAALGRTFVANEDVIPASHPVTVLGHALWRRRFGEDSTVVGQTVGINRIPMTVIGVAPAGFRGLSGRADLWITEAMGPLASYHGQLTDHQHFHNVIARLRPDVSLQDATAQLELIGTNIAAAVEHEGDGQWSATARRLHEARIDSTTRRSQLLLLGAVGFVLLIACANLVNLLLARAASRHREITIRLSVGSTRARLVRQLITESLLLSLVGGTIGVALAYALVDALAAFVPQRSPSSALTDFAAIGVDTTVLAFATAVSVGTGLVLGLAPALLATRLGHAGALGLRTHSTAVDRGPVSTSGLLIVAEFALAAILAVGATLLLTSYVRLQTRDVGFDPDNVLTFWVQPPLTQYRRDRAPGLMERILTEVSQTPGVETATVSLCTPLMGCSTRSLQIVGREWPADQGGPIVGRHYVAPDHFRTLGIPLLRGRALTAQDRGGRPGVVVVNETAARTYWPNEDPIGQRILLGVDDPLIASDSTFEIVGVVGDVQYDAIDGHYEPEFYTSYLQFTWPYAFVMVKSAEPLELLVPALRHAVAAVDSEIPIHDVQTLWQRVGTSLSRSRFNAIMLGGFATLALVLAAMGIYGVMANFVAQRTPEIGVRIALGAETRNVLGFVLGRGLRLVTIGLVVGVVGAIALARMLQSLVYEISVTDPRIFVAIVAILTGVAAAACYVPARRATRVDPMAVLRTE